MDYRLRIGSQIFGVAGIALLAFFALCPADWFPHTVLNFGLDHFLAFFVVTSILIVGWVTTVPARSGRRSRRHTLGGFAIFNSGSDAPAHGRIL
jgi:hypothetical protein